MEQYDLVIVGGGLVGGSLAVALVGSGLDVCLVEAEPLGSPAQGGYDERVIALSYGSRRILEGMGLWGEIAPEAAPIQQVHISDRGHFGFTHLSHQDVGVDALGYVVPARVIGQAIQGQLGGVHLLSPARVQGIDIRDGGATLEVAVAGEPRRIDCRLVVAADGDASGIRKQRALPVRERPYGYDALITTLTPEHPQAGVAFERFTDSGPLAMLPLAAGRYAVVWTVRAEESAHLLGLPDEAFLAALQERFGWRLGRLTRAGRRAAYPLKQVVVQEPVQQRLVLIGNAAHTLHPVAGQGLNLGLRDAAVLAEVLVEALAAGRDPGAPRVLDDYRVRRGGDHANTAVITDALARLFVNPWLPLRLLRNVGMLALDLAPGVRHRVARRFMTGGGTPPRLARGIPLISRGVR